ncbi:MAG: hypothetical protein KatS3mg022_0292 [Armatimonadota bacterium]|nr:MAG: hypothetical protein KatS3mg022_0292 [Armatimonadota bacterium]
MAMRTLLYDGVGNRTAMTVSFPAQPNLAGVTNYAYDLKNQLLSEQSTRAGGYTFSFGYDPAQNPTTFKGQSRTYNANNQLTGTGFAYDGNGNPVLYKGVNLAFDPENRMTAYGNVLTAGYNGDGLRAWKQTASGRRYYLYDGEELVCELDASGNVVAPVVFGANGLVVYSGYLYQFDPQGNAVHVLDDDGRTVLANLAYDAWGQLMSGSNPTPYGYKAQGGYYTDGETGLQLLGRYLDPATGRFLTRDPNGFEGEVNLYAYEGNQVVAPPGQKPGQGTGAGNGYKPVPPPRVPRPPFIVRCICVLGLLLCAKPTAPPETDELYPGPEPPCDEYERKGFIYRNPGAALEDRRCAPPGKRTRKNRTESHRCKGGEHSIYYIGRWVVTITCCPCRNETGVTVKRCDCNRKPKW